MFCKKCGAQIDSDSTFCSKCGTRVDGGASNEVVTPQQTAVRNLDKLNTEDTIKYLENVCKLENDRFALVTARNELQRKVDTYGIKRTNIYKPQIVHGEYEAGGYAMLLGVPVGALIGFIVGANLNEPGIGAGLGALAFILIGILMMIYQAASASKENKANYRAYTKEVMADNARVDRENACKPVFEQHIRTLGSKINALTKTIDKIYAYDVLYPKYRNDVAAVNTMYEYFLMGRVVSFTARFGNDGAYNIYENELRQNIIINKLDTIINQLEQIKANQHMLYEAVQEACMVSAKIADMAEHISSIDQNTALSAYYSKVSADNTATLNYMTLMSM